MESQLRLRSLAVGDEPQARLAHQELMQDGFEFLLDLAQGEAWPVYLDRLEKQGVFTTGILIEVSETPTRRQTLADHLGATINDVATWRDEALMLNLASFGPAEHQLLIQAGIRGLKGIVDLDLDAFKMRLVRPAQQLRMEPIDDLRAEGWWDQARTLEDE